MPASVTRKVPKAISACSVVTFAASLAAQQGLTLIRRDCLLLVYR